MITKIGVVAGKIWEYLDNSFDSCKINDLVNNLGEDRDMILMSLGWLAREGHIYMNYKDGDYLIEFSGNH